MKYVRLTALLSILYAPFCAAQTCKAAIVADAPDSRYVLKVDGTVIDKKTELVWMRCTLGQTWDGSVCKGSASSHDWQQALQKAKNSVFAGQSDWRLPNLKELQSLIEGRCFSPAVNKAIFPNPSSTSFRSFWSSTPDTDNNGGSWGVDFNYGLGKAFSKSSALSVRLVRGGL